MIATDLREMHYRLAIECKLCKSFTSMCAQSILDHHSGCKPSALKNAQNKKIMRR